jgi:hypothetical protein
MRTVYQVEISDAPSPGGGGWFSTRGGVWHFSNERAAKGMRNRLLRDVFGLPADADEDTAYEANANISITPINVYGRSGEPIEKHDTWPFEELG